MKVMVIDNNDSFSYNVLQSVGALGVRVELCNRDQLEARTILETQPAAMIIAPGPWSPTGLRQNSTLVKDLAGKVPILGINLGLHAIAVAFGARLLNTGTPMHGKSCEIFHDGSGVFQNLPSPLQVGCYHSTVIDPRSLSDQLAACAWTKDRTVMAVRHRRYPVYGVQFHPESILTPQGPALFEQFLSNAEKEVA